MKSKILFSCSLLTGLFVRSLSASPGSGARLVQSSEDGVKIEFSVIDYDLLPYSTKLDKYDLIFVKGANYLARRGYPELPFFSASIGVPLDASVNFSITEQVHRRIEALKPVCIPMGKVNSEDSISGKMNNSDPFLPVNQYQSLESYPEQVVEISEPHYLRNQKVVDVRFYPIQLYPKTNSAKLVSKIVVTINFNSNGVIVPRLPAREVPEFERVYQKRVLNYQASKMWRRGQRMTSRPTTSQFLKGERWVKVTIKDRGIYKLSFEDLQSIGIDAAIVDPFTFQMFYGGGLTLADDMTVPRPELEEISILIKDGKDGTFDPSDEIVFYGEAVDRFIDLDSDPKFVAHRYSNNNVFWLTWGNPDAIPKRMQIIDGSTAGNAQLVTTVRQLNHFEENNEYVLDEENNFYPIPDGFIWREVAGERSDFVFDLEKIDQTQPGAVRAEFYGTGVRNLNHRVQLFINNIAVVDTIFNEQEFPVTQLVNTGFVELPPGSILNGTNAFSALLPRGLGFENDAIFLGWFETATRNDLHNAGDIIVFEGFNSDDQLIYQLEGFTGMEPLLFEITDPFNTRRFEGGTLLNQTFTYQMPASKERGREFILLDRQRILSPISIEQIDIANLRSANNAADYIIVTNNEFISAAQELASFRQTHNGFQTLVIDVEDIYNEFAYGLPDVTAIRDFLKYAYENWTVRPSFVLLFGDGHLDYRGFTQSGRAKFNPLPPHIERDLVIDDFFAFFDAGLSPDMFIGRIPVQTAQQAQIAVNKVINYEDDPEFGDWRSRILLLADDRSISGRRCELLPHTEQIEEAEQLYPKDFQRRKIYMADFPFDPPDTGTLKPAVTQTLIDSWNEGALVVNYIGHGGFNVWAQERAFFVPRDLPRLRNGRKLPVVINSSCSIGHFDFHFERESMAEDLFRQEGRGAIASYAPTRLGFTFQNAQLNDVFVAELFPEDANVPTLGEVNLNTKVRAGNTLNNRRFALFGDPASRLAVPSLDVVYTSVPDSLQPLTKVTITGEIRENETRVELNGTAKIKVFDSPAVRVVSANCIPTPTTEPKDVIYNTVGDGIFSGDVSLVNGKFESTFFVPGNIPADTNAVSNARIFTYFSSDNSDGFGSVDSISVTPMIAALDDTVPPVIILKAGDQVLEDNDFIVSGLPLVLIITDESGVNVSGSPGFQILLDIDDGEVVRQDLTSLFNYELDSFQYGTVEFAAPQLESGKHGFGFRASDNARNTARRTYALEVGEAGEIKITNALNYPNPFSHETDITFGLSRPAKVTIKIFTVAGRLIRTLRMDSVNNFNFNLVHWDGRDSIGKEIANGVYLYKIFARATVSAEATVPIFSEDEATGKMMLMR